VRRVSVGRLGVVLTVAMVLTVAILAVTGCTSRSKPTVVDEPPASPTPRVVERAAPEPRPFTDRELADELRRQGIGATSKGDAPATSLPGAVPPEIKETPRGVVITFPHTHFAFDSYDLDPPARRVVERIAYVLNHPRAADRRVLLEGHADAMGTREYNLVLSRRRAETVARELIEQGVQRKRITVEAYGESRPVAPNTKPDGSDDPTGRAKNRRVEAIIRN
jgi:outer membrane protein OmpA-like peptidoglycan-associated protein